MADAVVSKKVKDGPDECVFRFTNVSDGTGEAAVIKVDKSALLQRNAVDEPTALDIAWIRWNVQGFARVTLLWDHTVDDVAYVMSSSGYDEAESYRDPLSGGGTGDLLITAPAGANAGSYDITVCLAKRP